MRVTVLADNNASPCLAAEWGLSMLIEAEGKKILFDLGASDVFLRNAARLNIDPLNLDYIVISHGHYDHTWGLDCWLKHNAAIPGMAKKPPVFLAHPAALKPKFRNDMSEFGILVSETTLKSHFTPVLSREPVYLTENLIFLGQIPRQLPFETSSPLGKTLEPDGSYRDDDLWDDTALVYQSGHGIVIITGCSHSGICNIIEYATDVCHEPRVLDIIGGFHLLGLNSDDRRLAETARYFKELNPTVIHPCHCTDLAAKMALAQAVKFETAVKEVTAGLTMEYYSAESAGIRST